LTAVGVAVVMGACGGGGGSFAAPPAGATPSVTVKIVDDAKATGAFDPVAQKVAVGAVVAWHNESGAVHNVTFSSKPAPKSSSTLSKGQTYLAAFPKAGTYKYTCSIHPGMKGSITVS
jgi:plastocyanin